MQPQREVPERRSYDKIMVTAGKCVGTKNLGAPQGLPNQVHGLKWYWGWPANRFHDRPYSYTVVIGMEVTVPALAKDETKRRRRRQKLSYKS